MSTELIEQPATDLQPREPEPTHLIRRDVRSAMMSLPVPEMQTMLAEWKDRRDAFRSWLLPQLEPGVHFGYVPGCAPKFDANGNLQIWNSKKSSYDSIPPDQWQAKPSLYQSGAQFLADLMNLVPVFDADLDAWTQLGKPVSTFVFRCRLYPKGAPQQAETLLGEGRGCRKVGQKGGDENNAIKMAQKSAMVNAVLNGYGLSDLFTQDMERWQPDEHRNPDTNESAPKAQPRGDRVTAAELDKLKQSWLAWRKSKEQTYTRVDWDLWCEAVCAISPADSVNAAAWSIKALQDGMDDMRMAGAK